ncbi:hypothetical protein HK102_003759 [Quaeritorhiza haematococci]|nr:hypothetical protein HK102_003759 [Quaeritorhiza haematococci]
MFRSVVAPSNAATMAFLERFATRVPQVGSSSKSAAGGARRRVSTGFATVVEPKCCTPARSISSSTKCQYVRRNASTPRLRLGRGSVLTSTFERTLTTTTATSTSKDARTMPTTLVLGVVGGVLCVLGVGTLLSWPVHSDGELKLFSKNSTDDLNGMKRDTLTAGSSAGKALQKRQRQLEAEKKSNSDDSHKQLVVAGGSPSDVTKATHTPKAEEKGKLSSPPPRPDLPTYSRDEVALHQSKEAGGIWVTHGDAVYDITEFVEIHPGGKLIMLAAGKSVDPFWAIFAVHQNAEIADLLEYYRIGTLAKASSSAADSSADDSKSKQMAELFAMDPPRDPALRVHSRYPANMESPPEALDNDFYTPNSLFYVRHHLPVPKIDMNSFKLRISNTPESEEVHQTETEQQALPKKEMSISVEDLKSHFPEHSITATLQCAGNRRADMAAQKPVHGLKWELGAIGNARWTGVRLSDVIKSMLAEHGGFEAVVDPSTFQPKTSIRHVCFEGADGYGASIPLEKALRHGGDVLIAYEMNGEPLPRDHGYPLRLVVPGHVAARSVKWLNKIYLSTDESPSHWQQRDYKLLPPNKAAADASDYEGKEAMQEMPVQSAVLHPVKQSKLEINLDSQAPASATVDVSGYAWSGAGRGIYRVDVSADGGKTWMEANLTREKDVIRQMQEQQPSSSVPSPPGRNREWGWTKWNAQVPLPSNVVDSLQQLKQQQQQQQQKQGGSGPKTCHDLKGDFVEIVARAVDTSYNVQPEKHVYNVRGFLSTGWHRVPVKVAGCSTFFKQAQQQQSAEAAKEAAATA